MVKWWRRTKKARSAKETTVADISKTVTETPKTVTETTKTVSETSKTTEVTQVFEFCKQDAVTKTAPLKSELETAHNPTSAKVSDI